MYREWLELSWVTQIGECVVGIPAEKGAMKVELGDLFHHEKFDKNVKIALDSNVS